MDAVNDNYGASLTASSLTTIPPLLAQQTMTMRMVYGREFVPKNVAEYYDDDGSSNGGEDGDAVGNSNNVFATDDEDNEGEELPSATIRGNAEEELGTVQRSRIVLARK